MIRVCFTNMETKLNTWACIPRWYFGKPAIAQTYLMVWLVVSWVYEYCQILCNKYVLISVNLLCNTRLMTGYWRVTVIFRIAAMFDFYWHGLCQLYILLLKSILRAIYRFNVDLICPRPLKEDLSLISPLNVDV